MAGFLVKCSSAAVQLQEKQSQSLRLDPYVSHREGSIVVLPAANVRGPPDKYSLLTLGRPSVRCYSTLWDWPAVCGSKLRVSNVCNYLGPISDLPCSRRTSLCWKGEFTPAASATTKGDMYVPGTYTKKKNHFPFDEIYGRLLFFTLGRSVSA